jgi:hypothetical protein
LYFVLPKKEVVSVFVRFHCAPLQPSLVESAIVIATDRPADDDEFGALLPDEDFEEQIANFHDDLPFFCWKE